MTCVSNTESHDNLTRKSATGVITPKTTKRVCRNVHREGRREVRSSPPRRVVFHESLARGARHISHTQHARVSCVWMYVWMRDLLAREDRTDVPVW